MSVILHNDITHFPNTGEFHKFLGIKWKIIYTENWKVDTVNQKIRSLTLFLLSKLRDKYIFLNYVMSIWNPY